jgi:hypothetical protein
VKEEINDGKNHQARTCVKLRVVSFFKENRSSAVWLSITCYVTVWKNQSKKYCAIRYVASLCLASELEKRCFYIIYNLVQPYSFPL